MFGDEAIECDLKILLFFNAVHMCEHTTKQTCKINNYLIHIEPNGSRSVVIQEHVGWPICFMCACFFSYVHGIRWNAAQVI